MDEAEELMAELQVDMPPDPAPEVGKRTFTAFPTIWKERLIADRASGALMRLALVLLARVYLAKPAPVAVTNAVLAGAGIDRRHKRELLEALESLGLVELEWLDRKS